jgi:hypothetical protein
MERRASYCRFPVSLSPDFLISFSSLVFECNIGTVMSTAPPDSGRGAVEVVSHRTYRDSPGVLRDQVLGG